MFSKNQKGQEAAPFELLIAVIMMGFVITVGTFALLNLQEQVCENEVEQKLTELKFAIEKVASGKGETTVNVTFPGCSTEQEFYVVLIATKQHV